MEAYNVKYFANFHKSCFKSRLEWYNIDRSPGLRAGQAVQRRVAVRLERIREPQQR
jgi:hypothetical protein